MQLVDINSLDQFNKMMRQKQIMCLYHWKYCGHCHSYMPTFEKIAQRANFPVMRVELSVMQVLPKQYNVPGFPVVVMYENGKKKDELVGNRAESDLHKFIMSNTKPTKPTPAKPTKPTPAKPISKPTKPKPKPSPKQKVLKTPKKKTDKK